MKLKTFCWPIDDSPSNTEKQLANTEKQLDAFVNDWLEKEKPIVVGKQTNAVGINGIVQGIVSIWYEPSEKPEVDLNKLSKMTKQELMQFIRFHGFDEDLPNGWEKRTKAALQSFVQELIDDNYDENEEDDEEEEGREFEDMTVEELKEFVYDEDLDIPKKKRWVKEELIAAIRNALDPYD